MNHPYKSSRHSSRLTLTLVWAATLTLLFLLAGCFGSSDEDAAADSNAVSSEADSTSTDEEDEPKKEKAIRVNVGDMWQAPWSCRSMPMVPFALLSPSWSRPRPVES